MILFGLFQKTVLADNFGLQVEEIQRMMSGGSAELPAGMGLLFAYAFALQIYCDFAAYTTIARGVARLFGVELMRNFLTPYFSTNPSEFWQRWHISLSTWLRDYLYIPLGGNQRGKLHTLRNLMLTMFLGGLWHGAGVFFIIWGLFHGLLLVIYRLVPIDAILINRFARAGRLLSMVLFFHLVCLGWIFFRATPEQFVPIMRSIAALPGVCVTALGTVLGNWHGLAFVPALKSGVVQFLDVDRHFITHGWGLVLYAVPVWITDYLGYRANTEFPDVMARLPWLVRALLVVVLIYGMQFFARREANEFIYFAF